MNHPDTRSCSRIGRLFPLDRHSSQEVAAGTRILVEHFVAPILSVDADGRSRKKGGRWIRGPGNRPGQQSRAVQSATRESPSSLRRPSLVTDSRAAEVDDDVDPVDGTLGKRPGGRIPPDLVIRSHRSANKGNDPIAPVAQVGRQGRTDHAGSARYQNRSRHFSLSTEPQASWTGDVFIFARLWQWYKRHQRISSWSRTCSGRCLQTAGDRLAAPGPAGGSRRSYINPEEAPPWLKVFLPR